MSPRRSTGLSTGRPRRRRLMTRPELMLQWPMPERPYGGAARLVRLADALASLVRSHGCHPGGPDGSRRPHFDRCDSCAVQAVRVHIRRAWWVRVGAAACGVFKLFVLFLCVVFLFSPSLFKLLHLQSKNTSKTMYLRNMHVASLG